MNKQIEIPSTLYEQLGSLARGFETPAQVIERLVHHFLSARKETEATPPPPPEHAHLPPKLEPEFFPSDKKEFKRLLLTHRRAWVILYKTDGTIDEKIWDAQNFSKDSDLVGNLRSGYLRNWRDKGIYMAKIAINKADIT